MRKAAPAAMVGSTAQLGYEYSDQLSFSCTFKHVSVLLKSTPTGSFVESPVLCHVRGHGIKVKFFPNGQDEGEGDKHGFVGISLKNTERKPWFIRLGGTFASERPMGVAEWHEVAPGEECDLIFEVPVGLFTNDDAIVITFAMQVLAGAYSVQNTTVAPSPAATFSSDVSALLQSGWGADATLQLQEGQRRVHKFVLSARSPVFRRMFETDMTEQRTGVVDMTDVATATGEQFIKFLYSDACPDDDAPDTVLTYLPLLALANKYEVRGLQDQCSLKLAQGMRVDNAAIILLFADKHNISALRDAATKFITSSLDMLAAVQDKPGFDDLDKDLLKELMSLVSGSLRLPHGYLA